MGGAEQGVGLSCPGRTPRPRLFPGATSAPQGAPLSRPQPGGCWSEALLLPDRQRDGAGSGRGSAVGARSHGAPQGAVVEGGCCRAGRGRGEGKLWEALGCSGAHRAATGTGAGAGSHRLAVPRGRGGGALLSPEPYRSQKSGRRQHRAAGAVTLHPRRRARVGGASSRTDTVTPGPCLCQGALAFGALSRIPLLWAMQGCIQWQGDAGPLVTRHSMAAGPTGPGLVGCAGAERTETRKGCG